ncbi:MAG: hydantoinase B/oxoprolinase family protein, partial [Bacillota bacterium]
AEQFHRAHHQTYGHSAPEEPVQLVNLRLSAMGAVRRPRLKRSDGPSEPVRPLPRSRRRVYFPGEEYVNTPIFSREDLQPGCEVAGPAIIQEAVSTTLVPPGFSVTCNPAGNLIATSETVREHSVPASDGAIDPISLQVLRNSFIAITEEMGMTLRKTGYSPNIKEREDCSTALFDASCRIIAQADYPMQPGHLGAMIYSVREAVATFPDDSWTPGDVVIGNDPHRGGNHLPDITLITPIFWGGKLRGFAANRAHHADVGGAVPGSISGKSTEIYQEGFIIPPLKLYEGGRLNRAIMELLRANVRTPEERTGDLRAQMAANEKGRTRLEELYDRYGPETVESAIEELIQYSERRMRHEIEQIPDGTYSFSDLMDDDGVSPERVQLRAAVTVRGSDITFDFSGSAPQTLGPINTTEAITAGTIFYVLRCLTDPSIPPNEGCYRPIVIRAPRGTVVNPNPPAAVVGGNLETAQRLCDVLIGAFRDALPERVIAACNGQMCNVGIGGMDRRRDPAVPYAYYETIGGGFGARAHADGIDGIHCHMTNTMNTPVEAIELAYPFIITHYSLIPDSAGPGQFRGGLGIRRDYRILGDDATFTLLAERRKTRPYGLFGGGEGQPGVDILDPETTGQRVIPGKHTVRLKPGQVVSIRTPGAGGRGDPLKRDPQLVLADVLEGRISEEGAEKLYGVVTSGGRVDLEGTARLHRHMQDQGTSGGAGSTPGEQSRC